MGKKLAIWMITLSVGASLLVVYLAKQQWDWLYLFENFEQLRVGRGLSRNCYSMKTAFEKEVYTLEASFSGLVGPRTQLADGLDDRLQRWRESNRWPRLLDEIYLISASDGTGPPLLERFDPDRITFESMPWSRELEPLRQRSSTLLAGPVLPPPRGRVLEVVTELPALLTSTHLPGIGGQNALQPAWLGLRLDQEFVREVWLPELVEMFFPPPNFDQVEAMVTETKSGVALFSTLPIDALEDFGRSDCEFGLVDAGTEGLELPRAVANQGREAIPNSRRPPTAADHAWFRDLWASYYYSGYWQLHLQRSGVSVADQVQEASRRSLVISFGALAMIGLAIGLIVVLARSAQKLARRQMRFLLGVTHELRTPLAVLSAAGDNLADALVDDPQQLQEYGRVIQDESLRLREMVENALHLARQNATMAPLVLHPLDIVRLVENTLARMDRLLQRAGFEVEIELPSESLQVQGETGALQSALLNLISNALKYGRSARWLRVSVTVAATAVAGTASGKEVQIMVEDRGSGIPPDEQGELFEPFYRGRSARGEQIEGSGLGLSLVRDVARAHHGRVSIDSQPGQGSRFVLHLPLLELS